MRKAGAGIASNPVLVGGVTILVVIVAVFLSYVFDQMMAINVFDENGHILKVNLSATECSSYQNADSLRRQEKQTPGFLKRCGAFLGPNQPGVTTPDPTRTGFKYEKLPPPPASQLRARAKRKQSARKPAPALPNVTVPSVPATPKAPNVNAGGGRSADPQALLDYLLSP